MRREPPLGEVLGTGRRAVVHEAEGGALKLYDADEPAASVFGEAAKMAAAAAEGVSVPDVLAVGRHHGRWGLLMSRCEGPSLAQRMRAPGADMGALLSDLARLHRHVHARRTDRLPGLRPRLRHRIGRATALTPAERRALIEGLSRFPPENNRICHGDFHPANILGPTERPVIIDWMDAAAGDPEADACRSWLLLRAVAPALAETYLDAYAASAAERAAILAWLPFVAAARTRRRHRGRDRRSRAPRPDRGLGRMLSTWLTPTGFRRYYNGIPKASNLDTQLFGQSPPPRGALRSG